MNIKAVFFDIDGTFYDHTTNRVLPSTKEAVRKLKEQGIKIALCLSLIHILKHLFQQCHSYLIAHTPVVRTASIFCNILIEAIGAVQLTACGYRLDQK